MSEKEERIMTTLSKVFNGSSGRNKDYLLGWVEGAAFAVCGPQQETPSDRASA